MIGRRTIFLDIDGVLVNHAAMQGAFGRDTDGMPMPDPRCIASLNLILEHTPYVYVVVTSLWRVRGISHLYSKLHRWGVRSAPFSRTPDLSALGAEGIWVTPPRGTEIQRWLDGNPQTQGQSFVILDDTADVGELAPSLVQTAPEIGLTRQDALRALRILHAPLLRLLEEEGV